MSTRYGFTCLDCDVSVVAGKNDEREMVGLFAIEKEFNALLDAYLLKRADLWLDFNALPGREWRDPLTKIVRFLDTHRGHRLCVDNEYRNPDDRIPLSSLEKKSDGPNA